MGLRQMMEKALSGALWPAVTLVLISALILLAGDAARVELRYERSALDELELWRLVTGHLVHLGIGHFLLNAAGLLLVALLVGDAFTARAWWLVVGVCVFTIDAAFWLLYPTLEWYVGLSGVLHGMLVAGVVMSIRTRTLESGLIAAAVAAKLLFEQIIGPLPGSEASSGGAVVVDAHLYGAIGGLVSIAILAGLRRARSV